MTTDMINHIKGTFQGLGEYFTLKLYPSYMLPIAVYLFGADNLFIVKAILALIIMDGITGIFAAYKVGDEIRSSRAVRSAYKLAIYGLLLSASHLAGVVTFDTNFVVIIMSTFLALTELISIIENAGRMGFAIPKKLLNQLQEWRDSGEQRVGLPTRRADEVVIPADNPPE